MRSTLAIITLSVLLIASVSVIIINSDFKTNKIINPDRTTYSIPDWVKHNAYWWSEGMITDIEYSYTIEYLIDEGIIETKKCEGSCFGK